MRRFLVSLFILCCCSFDGEIMQIDDISLLEQEVGELNTETLVLFDVDNTLIMPCDAVLRPHGERGSQSLIAKLIRDPTLDTPKYSDGFLLGRVLLMARWDVVDPRSVGLIRKYQQRDIPVLAFTGSGAGKIGEIENFSDFRIDQLKKLGFDFGHMPFFPEFLQLSCKGSQQPPPFLKSGILFASNHPKGEVLKTFLKKLQFSPRKVIFIDDRIDFIQSVEEAMAMEGIECIAIHYTAMEKNRFVPDEKIAELQVRHLIEKGEWLSDDQARAHLQKRSHQISNP